MSKGYRCCEHCYINSSGICDWLENYSGKYHYPEGHPYPCGENDCDGSRQIPESTTRYLALEVIVEITDDMPEDVLEEIHRLFCKDPKAEFCPMQSAACTSVDSIEKAYDWLNS